MALKIWLYENEKRVGFDFLHYKMNNPWIVCGIGFLFCCAGIYLFFKNVYEEEKSIKWPVLILLMGVLIIAIGTAKYFKLTT
jgi:H+/Cl- antiporter ClcA